MGLHNGGWQPHIGVGALDKLSERPEVHVVREERYADDGKYVTSAGISAGIDMSLRLMKRVFQSDVAREVRSTWSMILHRRLILPWIFGANAFHRHDSKRRPVRAKSNLAPRFPGSLQFSDQFGVNG